MVSVLNITAQVSARPFPSIDVKTATYPSSALFSLPLCSLNALRLDCDPPALVPPTLLFCFRYVLVRFVMFALH